MRNTLVAAGVAASVIVGGGAGFMLFGPGGAAAKSAPRAPQPVDVVVSGPAPAVTTTTVSPQVLLPETTAPPATVKPLTPTTVAPEMAIPSITATTVAPSLGSFSAASVPDDAANAYVMAAVQAAGVSGTPNGARLGDHGDDANVAAGAIGIPEADLITALKSGQSLAQIATAKGVAAQKVIDALVADGKDEIAAAFKAGRINQTQADQLNANVVQRVTAQVNATGLCPGGARGAGTGGGPGPLQEAVTDTSVAAGAVGIPEADLITALKSGQSLAQIATAKGAAVQKVIDALVADGKDEIAAAFKAGRINQTQADQLNADVVQRVTDRVNRAPGAHPAGGPGPGGARPHHP